MKQKDGDSTRFEIQTRETIPPKETPGMKEETTLEHRQKSTTLVRMTQEDLMEAAAPALWKRMTPKDRMEAPLTSKLSP